MKLRLLLLSVSISALAVGVTWVSLQPAFAQAARGGNWQQPASVALVLDAALVTLVGFLVLHLAVGRRVERLVAAAQPLVTGFDSGPLFSRLERGLKRLAVELAGEREVNQRRFDELAKSHDELLRLQAELVAADRLATVGKLASGVAHEVGNPLSGILGYLSVLRSRLKDSKPELLELLERIEQEVQRIDGIVRSLLELGRPSRGKAQALDVRVVVDSCVKLLAAGRDFQGVQVQVEGPPSLWLRAEAGPLSQVLVNLLLNGAQAMGGTGKLVVRLEADGRIVVDDEGPGLSADVKAKLFQPFFTTKAPGTGTGLGLAVSRHLLSQFDGALEAGDAPGGGARFTISLPLP